MKNGKFTDVGGTLWGSPMIFREDYYMAIGHIWSPQMTHRAILVWLQQGCPQLLPSGGHSCNFAKICYFSGKTISILRGNSGTNYSEMRSQKTGLHAYIMIWAWHEQGYPWVWPSCGPSVYYCNMPISSQIIICRLRGNSETSCSALKAIRPVDMPTSWFWYATDRGTHGYGLNVILIIILIIVIWHHSKNLMISHI